MNEIETEGLTLAYAALDGAARNRDHKRLAELFVQLHAPRETVTLPTQDGLVVRHGVLRRRPPKTTLHADGSVSIPISAPVQLDPPKVTRKKKPHV